MSNPKIVGTRIRPFIPITRTYVRLVGWMVVRPFVLWRLVGKLSLSRRIMGVYGSVGYHSFTHSLTYLCMRVVVDVVAVARPDRYETTVVDGPVVRPVHTKLRFRTQRTVPKVRRHPKQ